MARPTIMTRGGRIVMFRGKIGTSQSCCYCPDPPPLPPIDDLTCCENIRGAWPANFPDVLYLHFVGAALPFPNPMRLYKAAGWSDPYYAAVPDFYTFVDPTSGETIILNAHLVCTFTTHIGGWQLHLWPEYHTYEFGNKLNICGPSWGQVTNASDGNSNVLLRSCAPLLFAGDGQSKAGTMSQFSFPSIFCRPSMLDDVFTWWIGEE